MHKLDQELEAAVEQATDRLDTTEPYQTAVCQRCQQIMFDTWKTGEQLCCQCGLDYELFHPEARWMDGDAQLNPTLSIRYEVAKQSLPRIRSRGRCASWR